MNILVVGRGGREHSIVKKLLESKRLAKLYVAPGNGGIAKDAQCVPIDEMNIDELVRFAKEAAIDLTIVGPEAPLNAGIADAFSAEGLRIFAPRKNAAIIEGSKSFAKQFMKKYEIPTAEYETFTEVEKAKAYIEEKGAPIVIKADGLAAGKGVVVAQTKSEAIKAAEDMLVGKAFSDACSSIVIEEFLEGEEFSLMAFVHENKVYPMIPARDHKRAFDGDEGPNTGGMGAFAPAEISKEQIDFSVQEILQKTADGMMIENRTFTGILYGGLILTAEGPKVIEFNARFGDPETEVVLPLLKNDLVQVITDILDGQNPQLQWEDQHCLGTVVASRGYPNAYEKGHPIPALPLQNDAFLIYAGVQLQEKNFVSDGGRVLLVGAKADTLKAARAKVYETLAPLENSRNFFFRKDIGVNS